MNKFRNIILVLAIFLIRDGFSQSQRNTFISTEYAIGKIIPNYPDTFPKTTLQQGVYVSFGTVNTDTTSWAKYFNYPEAGLMFIYTNFGNNAVFGHQVGVDPYIAFKVFNKSKGNYKLKMGLGIAYFNTIYDKVTNPSNIIVGAPFTWDVKMSLYRTIYNSEKFDLLFGAGVSHESNGHTQEPNKGINSVLLSLSGRINTGKKRYETPARVKGNNLSPKKMFFNYRQGFGFHEQFADEEPESDIKKMVYASSISVGYTFNKHLKLRTGFTYKHYQHYYNYAVQNPTSTFGDEPQVAASNLVFYVGNELLMSHFSIDMELGVNLYKPFYWEYKTSSEIGSVLMKYVATRLGLNAYLFNTNNLPPHNFFIGANINANLGRADFTEFSVGYTHNFK